MDKSMCGKHILKSRRRGASQRVAKVGGTLTDSICARCLLAALLTATSISPNRRFSVSASSSPAVVSSTAWCRRTNSGTPSAASSCLTWRLMAPCVTCRASPARVKLPSRAATAKALSAFSGGRRFKDMGCWGIWMFGLAANHSPALSRCLDFTRAQTFVQAADAMSVTTGSMRSCTVLNWSLFSTGRVT